MQNGPELLSNGNPSGIAEAFSHPPQHIREDFGTTRFDDNLSSKDLLFAVYTVDDSAANTPSANPLSHVNESLREQVASVQEQHVFSPSLLNTARFGYLARQLLFHRAGAGERRSGLGGGRSGGRDRHQRQHGLQRRIGDHWRRRQHRQQQPHRAQPVHRGRSRLLVAAGASRSRRGVWLQRVQSNDLLAQYQYGQASFCTLTTFLQGTVATFTVVPAPTELGWRSLEAADFLEDTIKVTPRLELRAGFRLESTNGWNESQARASNYAIINGVLATTPFVGSSALWTNRAKFLPNPRVGFAWDMLGNGKTAVRGGFGLYHGLLDTLDYRLDQTAPYNTAESIKTVAV